MKQVFRHLKRKLFNSCMDHRLHSFLPLIDFYRSWLGYAIIVNILCTYFCWCNFLCRQNLKIFYKHLSICFSTISINFRMYITCANKVANIKVSMLSSTSFICLALAISYLLWYYCSLSNLIFSTHCCRFPVRISLRWI